MAHILSDRVREVSTTTGTTDFALGGAVTDFRAFSAVMANGDTCWYAAILASGGGWEVGLGTWVTGGTLQRTTILASSTGSKISFAAGSKDIFMVLPASAVGQKTTASNIWVGTNDALFMTAKNAADAGAFITLTSSTAIATDCATGINFFVTLAHNTTFGAPTNAIDGRTYTWLIQQDATGSRTGAFNSAFEFTSTPTLSTTAGKRDLVVATYHAASGKFIATFRKAS